MKLTPEKARELRKRGIKVDPRQIVREQSPTEERQSEPQSPPEKPDLIPVILDGLVEVARSNESNIGTMSKLSESMLAAMAEIAKPKPPKHWTCTIGRNSRGEMATVDIKEQ